ncbi:MAG TPA: hypothetical protein VF221_17065 [Chloroflexota bacterium]
MSDAITPLPAGAIAPDFTLGSTPRQSRSLHSVQGHAVVLIFCFRG